MSRVLARPINVCGAFARPSGLWLRVCPVSRYARIVAGASNTRERAS